MKLVYINKVGKNFKGDLVYEFLFSAENLDNVEGESWDCRPAAGNPSPPLDYVNRAYSYTTTSEFGLIQDHETFNMDDARHGIIPLAWEEDFEFEDSIYDKRLCFRFGESVEEVESKLYARDKQINKIYEKTN